MDNKSWLYEAEKRFPELDGVDSFRLSTPYLLWGILLEKFRLAYNSPVNENLIKRTYEYADWCIAQPRGETAENDLATCVAVCFFEEIPLLEASRSDMPRWFSLEDFVDMEQLFRSTLSKEEFDACKTNFIPEMEK